MPNRFLNAIAGLSVLMLALATACSPTLDVPPVPPTNALIAEDAVTATSSPKPGTGALVTQQPPAIQAKFTLGYVSYQEPYASPVFLVEPQAGLIFEVRDVQYNTEKAGVLAGYQQRIAFPDGEIWELVFSDFQYNPEGDEIVGYQVTLNGEQMAGPGRDAIDITQAQGWGFAPPPGNWLEPLPYAYITMPCQGDSNVEYDYPNGVRQVLRHTITCENPVKVYLMDYSAYTYNAGMALTGYMMVMAISPE
jgi:hypothetical protein